MYSYKKRAVACFLAVLLLMSVCGARIGVIATDDSLREAAANQSKRSVKVADLRGNIYDCNGKLLTGAQKRYVTVVFPCTQGVSVLTAMLKGEELTAAIKKLSKGNVAVIDKSYKGESDGAVTLSVPIRYNGSLSHVLGYIDGSGHGVSGVEYGCDDILFSQNGISVTYSSDPSGKMLVGDGFLVSNGNLGSVTLTIDSDIQRITENAMAEVQCGAAVVVDAKNGKIRAMVSMPQFDSSNVADYINAANSPLINRALFSYNVGSVFKPLVAAAALENGLGGYVHNCMGSIQNAGITFKCNKIVGHGEINLKEAVAQSCNTYFYTLAGKIGATSIYNMASKLWFGKELDLGGGIVTKKGVLPDVSALQSSSALINLSIGQGELLLSPVAVANLYCAIANGGVYRLPSLIEGIEQNGVYKKKEENLNVRVMDEAVADVLKEYLKYTLKEGTGSAAYTEGIAAGGKTGTAQTGWKDGNRNILNGWFCGFVECGKTTYVIVILKEDVKSGSYDCAPIFKSIASVLGKENKSNP